jgi:long-chain acyl-CoA synthetase
MTTGANTTLTGNVCAGDIERSREELMARAARVATGLAADGVAPGDSVGILMRNDLAFVEAVFAAGFLGAQAVPLNWHFKAAELEYILADSGATHLVGHADLLRGVPDGVGPAARRLWVSTPGHLAAAYGIAPELCSVPPQATEWEAWLWRHDPLPRGAQAGGGGMMMYTSGTTGRPKGVRRAAVDASRREDGAALRQRWFGNRPGMRTAIIGPMYHSVQLSYTTAAVSAPGAVLLESRFDAERLLALIEAQRLTHLHLVPIMMARLVRLPEAVRARYDISSLEFVVHGSAPCPPDVKRRLIDWVGPIVHEYYGTTETGMVSRSSSQEWLKRPGTVGRPWPGREVRIYDSKGNLQPPGAQGEIYMSLGAMPDFTYQNDPGARRRIDRDGLVTSGDVGYLDEDGYLFICDRKRDMVISGGVNIYPAEVEAVLASHPDVVDTAVFGIPDAEYGERVHGVVELRGGSSATAAELVRFTRERLASFKVPREIEVHASLPRDESGKIAKRRLREPFWAAAGRRI